MSIFTTLDEFLGIINDGSVSTLHLMMLRVFMLSVLVVSVRFVIWMAKDITKEIARGMREINELVEEESGAHAQKGETIWMPEETQENTAL